MGKFDSLLIEGGFATGSLFYTDHYEGEEEQARIVLYVAPVSNPYSPVPMIVDTGAPWCIVNPEMADEWELTTNGVLESTLKINIRGYLVTGQLSRTNILLKAISGQNLNVEATFFVPKLSAGETWRFPNFLGLDGFLNRIRFAVDPAENTFYFGPT